MQDLDRGAQGLGLGRGPCFGPVPAAPRSSAPPTPGAGTACSERAPSLRAAPLPRAPAPASLSAASGSARGRLDLNPGRGSGMKTRWKAASAADPLIPAPAFSVSGSRPLKAHHSERVSLQNHDPHTQHTASPTHSHVGSLKHRPPTFPRRVGSLSRPGLTFSCSFLEAEIFDFFCRDEVERGCSREGGAQVGSGRGLRARPPRAGSGIEPASNSSTRRTKGHAPQPHPPIRASGSGLAPPTTPVRTRGSHEQRNSAHRQRSPIRARRGARLHPSNRRHPPGPRPRPKPRLHEGHGPAPFSHGAG